VTVISEVRERFLTALATEVDPAQVAEIHFFSAIRQGGVESGVAVVVAYLPGDNAADARSTGDAAVADDAPAEDRSDVDPTGHDPSGGELTAEVSSAARRFTVHTARYRLVLKGPDRGRWETSVVEEADAPLLTVETVVRGVQRRAGDLEDPERMDGAVVREILSAVEARRPGAR
jgi:hypothetical protein